MAKNEPLAKINEMKKQLDLNELGAKITELFNEGKTDEEIAKELNQYGVNEQRVQMIRLMLGLSYRQSIDVFKESKTLHHDPASETFEIKFRIPDEVLQKLNMTFDKDYTFFASVVSRKTIQLTFLEKQD